MTTEQAENRFINDLEPDQQPALRLLQKRARLLNWTTITIVAAVCLAVYGVFVLREAGIPILWKVLSCFAVAATAGGYMAVSSDRHFWLKRVLAIIGALAFGWFIAP